MTTTAAPSYPKASKLSDVRTRNLVAAQLLLRVEVLRDLDGLTAAAQLADTYLADILEDVARELQA